MNREEAIKILKDTLYDEKTPTDYLEAVKMGREALENQKSVIEELEKIKEKISKLTRYYTTENGHINLVSDNAVYRIIDKELAELKGENNE